TLFLEEDSMLKRNFLSWLTTSALMCALAGPAHAVVLSDTTFNDGDWSLGAAADTSTGLAPHPSRPVVVAGDPPTVQLYANELLATSAGGFAVLSGIGVQFDM